MNDDEQLRCETELGIWQVGQWESRVRDLYARNREIASSIHWGRADVETHKRMLDYYKSLEDLDDARAQLGKARREANGYR